LRQPLRRNVPAELRAQIQTLNEQRALLNRQIQNLQRERADHTNGLGSILSPEELNKFKEFAAAAINNNRMALTMNRKMMSPGTK